jgi:hypothetical protein
MNAETATIPGAPPVRRRPAAIDEIGAIGRQPQALANQVHDRARVGREHRWVEQRALRDLQLVGDVEHMNDDRHLDGIRPDPDVEKAEGRRVRAGRHAAPDEQGQQAGNRPRHEFQRGCASDPRGLRLARSHCLRTPRWRADGPDREP